MNFCVNQSQLEQLIDNKLNNKNVDDRTLADFIANADSWVSKIGIITYILAKVKEKYDIQNIIEYFNNIFDFPNHAYIEFQECDSNFITQLLNHNRNREMSLEEELIQIEYRILNHNYD